MNTYSIFDDSFERVQQQLCGILSLELVLFKLLGELSGNWQLLWLQEALKQHLDCHVHIGWPDIVSQMQLGKGLRHSDDGLDMPNCNRNTADGAWLTPDVCVELGDFILVDLWKFRFHVSLRVNQIFLEHLLWNDIWILLVHAIVWEHVLVKVCLASFELLSSLLFWDLLIFLIVFNLSDLWMVLHVWIYDESSQSIVVILINLVLHDGQEIKSRKNWSCEINIIIEIQRGIVISLQRVSCCNDTASCLQAGVDSSLGDRDGLLFHGFVDWSSVLIVHFVELINETDTFVC